MSSERGEAAKEVYTLAGRAIAHSREKLAIAEDRFNHTAGLTLEQEALLANQRRVVIEEFNELVREWNARKSYIYLNLIYYYPDTSVVASSWIEVEEAGSALLDCAGEARDAIDGQNCTALFLDFDAKLKVMTEILGANWRSTLEH